MLNQKIRGLYAITPDKPLNLANIQAVLRQYKPVVLQYRRKNENPSILLTESRALRQICRQHNTIFIINDDINLCKKIQADGVHLGQTDDSITRARRILGANALIGVSCYDNLPRALTCQHAGANYVAFGALFASKTKPNAPLCPLSVINAAKTQLTLPIVGIGGINFANQAQVYAAGAQSVAMVSALFD